MKTLKTINLRLFFCTLILLSVSNCRTKLVDITRSRTSERHAGDISIQSRQNETYQGDRVIFMSDSGYHQYRVNIIPLDTFSFSLEQGFKGRAASIELAGAIHQNKETLDRTTFTVEKRSDIGYDRERRMRKTEASSTKEVKKKIWPLLTVLMCVGMVALIAWLYKRFLKIAP